MRSFNVKVNGKVYQVEVEEAISNLSSSQSAPFATSVGPASQTPNAAATPAPQAAPAPISVPTGGVQLLSPLPGNIWHVEVADGALVKKGQKVFALEAMKMEHDVLSPADGKVTLLVKKGDAVVTDTVLAVIS